MSAEPLAISAVIELGAGAMRTMYAEGVSADDFVIYAEEWEWLEKRIQSKRDVNARIFRSRFPEFEYLSPDATPKELAAELRDERTFEQMSTLLNQLNEDLSKDNAAELVTAARDQLSKISKQHSPHADMLVEDWVDHVADIRRIMQDAKRGVRQGYSSGLPFLDHHWGGILPGQGVLVLGRTGEGKSYITTLIGLECKLQGAKVGIFTPEMSVHEVRCRIHTLASARKEIQKAVGIQRSFRNRALLYRNGFSLKTYARFCEYFASLPGEMHILSGKHRKSKMSVEYIEDRIVDLGLDVVIIDPIYLLKPARTYKDNPYAEIGATAEALEGLTETYNISMLVTNQAHRQGGEREDAPHKDKSFGSDLPAQLADYVLGVKHISDDNKMICRCTKSRFGQSFRFELDFFANTGVVKTTTPLAGAMSYLNGADDPDEDELKDLVESAVRGGDDND